MGGCCQIIEKIIPVVRSSLASRLVDWSFQRTLLDSRVRYLQCAEILFLNYLVEDKAALGLSYVEYLVQTHRQIQNRMT